MDSTGKAKRRKAGDTEPQDQVRRMANIMAKVGCPHGRLYPEAEPCTPCWVNEQIAKEETAFD